MKIRNAVLAAAVVAVSLILTGCSSSVDDSPTPVVEDTGLIEALPTSDDVVDGVAGLDFAMNGYGHTECLPGYEGDLIPLEMGSAVIDNTTVEVAYRNPDQDVNVVFNGPLDVEAISLTLWSTQGTFTHQRGIAPVSPEMVKEGIILRHDDFVRKDDVEIAGVWMCVRS